MGLNNIQIPERTVPFGVGSITVRAISLTDIMLLLDAHGPTMAAIWGKVQSEDQLKTADIKLMIGSIAREFPDMAAALMGVAADSYNEEDLETIRKLPISTQIELIEAIFELTFPSEAEVKKLIESLTRVMTGVSGALTELKNPLSPNGIGVSAAA